MLKTFRFTRPYTCYKTNFLQAFPRGWIYQEIHVFYFIFLWGFDNAIYESFFPSLFQLRTAPGRPNDADISSKRLSELPPEHPEETPEPYKLPKIGTFGFTWGLGLTPARSFRGCTLRYPSFLWKRPPKSSQNGLQILLRMPPESFPTAPRRDSRPRQN